MCGIAGFIGKVDNSVLKLTKMVHSIHHRGPDDHGIWLDEVPGMGLAHARLSVLDLSPAGHQPMHSDSGRFVMVFNGEIYNHHAIREELESAGGASWRGRSDTETLLAAIECWGLEATLKKTRGMFAIALWDKTEKTLSLARDRMGEKPLYYGWVNNNFVFASELKAIKALPDFNNAIDRSALALYLRYNSIPAPYSIYENIFKLEPGCVVLTKPGQREIQKSLYWSTSDAFELGSKKPFNGSATEAVNQLEDVLKDAVVIQMQADVPLGAFLSGGVDSSTVVALMQAQSSQRVKSFSIGFESQAYNEAEHARAVAKHLGTEHHDLYVTSEDALRVIPLLPDMYDEPFADSSQIPTYLLSKIAKEKVTVSLSGDAGDELFGGYNRYIMTDRMWERISKVPMSIRHLSRKLITTIPPDTWSKSLGFIMRNSVNNIGAKLHKGAGVLGCKGVDDLYTRLISQVNNPEDWLIDSLESDLSLPVLEGLLPIEKMMVYDLIGYLPTDILTKVDRATMATSLEARVPMLDPKVIEFAASLPLEYKIRNGVGKWVLREVLYKHVPKELIERPKMGFGVPLSEWLRGPLREWAEALLDEKRLLREGFFKTDLVRKTWREHLTGKRDWEHQLWSVLMFQAWLERNE